MLRYISYINSQKLKFPPILIDIFQIPYIYHNSKFPYI